MRACSPSPLRASVEPDDRLRRRLFKPSTWHGRSSTRAGAALSLCAFAALAPARAAAQDDISPQLKTNYGEHETARSAGLSGAMRALGNGTTAVLMNPADMVATRVYHIEALAQLTPEAARQVYGGVIVDSMTGRLAGGIAFFGGFIDPEGINRSFIDARLALAFPITERLFIGLTGRYAKITQSGDYEPLTGSRASRGLVDPDAEASIPPERSPFYDGFTFDAGLTVKATDSLHLAVLGQNLSYPNTGAVPTSIGGGIGYGTSDLSIEVDAIADFNSYTSTSARVMAGAELLLGDHFPLRAGYKFDGGASVHAISAGLGYIHTDFSVEASVHRTLSDPGATTIVIGLAYFLESASLGRAAGLD